MSRIASLYLPWFGIVIKNVGRLDYRKCVVNRILKRPLDLSTPRYFNVSFYILIYNIRIITQ